jgi:hypothetical protein
MSEEQKIIQEQQKIIDEMKDGLRAIGDYADALKNVTSYLLEDVPEGVLVKLTLNEMIKLVEQNL